MRVDEAEGGVARQSNALAGRRQRDVRFGAGGRDRDCKLNDAVEVKGALHGVGETVNMGLDAGMLFGLHQTKMALGQGQGWVTQNSANHGQVDGGDCVASQALVCVRYPAD
jgi:hypothetical protein